MKQLAFLLLFSKLLAPQSIEVFSEFAPFERPPDSPERREILSPAVPRNGFTTFRVLVNAPAGANYFLFCQTNPAAIVEPRLYKVALPSGLLEAVRSPNFGAMPDDADSRAYLLDIWVPKEAEAGRRVRLELQLKIGDWIIYPMELRIQKAAIPRAEAPREDPATLAQALERNREQDLALENMLELPEVTLLTAQQIVNKWNEHSPFPAQKDSEWYLRVRDLLYKRADER